MKKPDFACHYIFDVYLFIYSAFVVHANPSYGRGGLARTIP